MLIYWRTEFIQDIQGWFQTHSKTNSKICIHILYRRMFSDTPFFQWSQLFRPHQVGRHSSTRSTRVRSWAWRIPPIDRWQRGWPRGTSADTTKQKKISNLSGMDSDPKSPFQKKSISISISISKNIQISQISNPRSSTASRGRNMWIFWRLGIPRVPWTPKLSDLPRWVILGGFLDHDLAGFLCHDPEAAIKISSYWYI